VTGTFCPLPILLAAREMLHLETGDRLEIVGDDPGILEDMPVWCERAGHRLIDIAERDGRIISLVEKATGPKRQPAGRGRPARGGAAPHRAESAPAPRPAKAPTRLPSRPRPPSAK
jgi:TusA-related sulfurtransferase